MQQNENALITFAENYITKSKIEFDMDFIKTFMFCFDSKDEFPINLDLMVVWKIDSRHDNAKKRLVKFCTERIDFIVKNIRKEQQGTFTPNGVKPHDVDKNINSQIFTSELAKVNKEIGGRPNETIFLTTECFKIMCMTAKNEIGKKVRNYYLLLEKIFKLYMEDKLNEQNFIAQNQLTKSNRKNNQLQGTLNKIRVQHSYHKFKKGPAFYILLKSDGNIKPGKDIDVNRRFKEYRTSDPLFKIQLIVFTSKNEFLETMILEKYKAQKVTNNHELLDGKQIDVASIIKSTLHLLEFLKLDHTIEKDIVKYNQDIDLMDKNSIKNSIEDDIEAEIDLTEDIVIVDEKQIANNSKIEQNDDYVADLEDDIIVDDVITVTDDGKDTKIPEDTGLKSNMRSWCTKCEMHLPNHKFYKKDAEGKRLRSMCKKCCIARDLAHLKAVKTSPFNHLKKCTRCEQFLKFVMFYKSSETTDKLMAECMSCYKKNNACQDVKQCLKCEKVSSYANFHKDIDHKDGYATWCKPCRNKSESERRANKKLVEAKKAPVI